MKKFSASFLTLRLILLSSCVFVASCSSPTPSPTPISSPSPQIDPFEIDWDDRSLFKEGLTSTAQPILEGLGDASVYHMDLDIADNFLHVTGIQEVRYTNSEDVPLDSIYFRLFPNILGGEMIISDVRVDEEITTVNYDLDDSLMIVPLIGPLQPGDSTIIHTEFSVTIPDSLDLNYGMLAYAENVLALAHAYPMVAVYDDEGWNAEIPPQDGDITFADMSFYLVRVTAPKELTLVTSGIEISHAEAGQDQVLTVASGPARDFYLAASSEYEEISQDFGAFRVRSFAPPDFASGSEDAVEIAARAIEIFSEQYTPYPYTELDIVATPTLALGIEYPGIVAITSWTYDTGDSSARDFREATVAHEVGHQWFYNLIGDDQLDDPWLDESLTQFATLQYFLDAHGTQGYEGFLASLEDRWARVEFAKIPIGLPVEDYDGAEYGAIVYGRGPLFFVALKEEMGMESFEQFLREYAETLSWEISTPETLQALAEKHCDCELDRIFGEWVFP